MMLQHGITRKTALVIVKPFCPTKQINISDNLIHLLRAFCTKQLRLLRSLEVETKKKTANKKAKSFDQGGM